MFNIPSFSAFKIPQSSVVVNNSYIFVGAFTNRQTPLAVNTVVNRIDKVSFTNVPDTSFLANTGSAFNGNVRSVKQYDSGVNIGKLMLTQAFTSFNAQPNTTRIVRLNANGSFDASFFSGSGFNAETSELCIDIAAGNKVYVVGGFTSYNGISVNRIVRLNDDGSIDGTFNVGAGFNGTAQSIDQDANYIYVAGNFTSYKGSPCNHIVKIEKSTGNLISPSGGTNSDCFAVRLDVLNPNFMIVGGNGAFSSFNGVACKTRIARVNVNTWALDTAFDALTTSINARVSNIDFTNTGNVILAGNFTNFFGAGKNYLAQLNPNGSLNATFNPANPNLPIRAGNFLPVSQKVSVMGAQTNYAGLGARDRVAIVDAVTGAVDANFNNTYFGGNGDGWMALEVF
jgi:hypothetical protein